VLRQYCPGEVVLKLSGRECLWIKNPFTKSNNPTLMIRCIDSVFMFEDNENPKYKGDPFDFAALYFNLEGDELLIKLNDCLYLDIEKKRSFYGNNKQLAKAQEIVSETLKDNNIAIPVFSFFNKPVKNTTPNKTVNLLDVYKLVKGNSFKIVTDKLRAFSNKVEARTYKANNFDYVTFSGTFSKREDKALIKHSGLLTVDFDHVPDIVKLKSDLLKDEYFETELLFVSPSGDGLKWIISIDITQFSHAEYFEGLQGYISQTYNLKIDKSGSDISRACFLGHDPNIFINSKHI
jgi:hypothetical protein